MVFSRNVMQILFLWMVLCSASVGVAQSDGITPKDIAKLKTVSQVRISPDAAYIAYTLNVPRTIGEEPDGSSWRELHVLTRATGTIRPFITGAQNVSSIDWLPDSSAVSFTAKRFGESHSSLYIIPVDGGEARKAATGPTGVRGYSFGPGAAQVAIISKEKAAKNLESQKAKGFTQSVVEEDWVPASLYITKPFSDQKPRKLELPGSVFQATWSPAGNAIAVSLAPNPLVDSRYTSQKIHIIDPETGRTLHKVGNEGKLGSLHWRPDGKMLAFIGAQDKHDPSAGRPWMFDLESGKLFDPLNNHQGQIRAMAWQSNDHLMLIDEVGVWTKFVKVGANGKGYKELVPPGGAILQSISLSEDGQNAAFVASTPQHPNEVYSMSHGDKQPKRLTTTNLWLDARVMGVQEVVKFKARDGLELEGILIHPTGKKKQAVPLIMYVHGGPESHHKNGWLTSYSSPGQVAAARGMAVFHTNYRGSTGRGVAFSRLSQGEAGGKEFDDLVDAVDHLISKGLVDKNKVAVTGGSYGGYATAWCSTYYSDRFAAGVMFVGISNTISRVGTTDIPEEEYLVHALKRPWDNWREYLEASPIYYGAKHKTPLLILHGTDDPRVNVGQSRELYRQLKVRGQAPVRLVTYPGEGHGNTRAASRYDYHLRAMRWLEHYLLGEGGDPPAYQVDYQLDSK